MQIERVFDKNASLERIIDLLITSVIEKELEKLFQIYVGQADISIEELDFIRYNDSEEIDCIVPNKGGIQK